MVENKATYLVNLFGISRLFLLWALLILIGIITYYIIKICNNHVIKKQQLLFGYKFRVKMFFVIAIALCIFLALRYNEIIISSIYLLIWSIVFAYLLNPFVTMISRHNVSRGVATIVVFTAIVVIIVVLGFTITPMITKQTTEFISLIPEYFKTVTEYIDEMYNAYIVRVNNLPRELLGFDMAIDDYITGMQLKTVDVIKGITDKSLAFFSNILVIIMIPIFTFYFLKDTAYFKRKLVMFIPRSSRDYFVHAGRDVNRVLNRYIRGQIIVAIIVGIVSVITLMMIGVDFALILGMIAGVMNIIPYFGPIFGAIPAMLVALIDQPIKALWVALAFFIIQQAESTLIQPKISGDSVNLHPVVILIALLIGGELFGVMGLVFAVPIAGSIKIIILHIKKIFVKI